MKKIKLLYYKTILKFIRTCYKLFIKSRTYLSKREDVRLKKPLKKMFEVDGVWVIDNMKIK